MAVLEVIVRTFGQRPSMLARNLASLEAQTVADWQRTLVVDDAARGCAWANANLATVEATGDYVWVLDDDDVCCRSHLVAELQTIAHMERPDVIMVRAFHERFGLLPNDANWQQRPVRGNVGYSCYIVRRDVWNAYRDAMTERYDADFWWIDHLWQQRLGWYWHDVTAAWYPQQSIGEAEEITANGTQRIGDGDAR
jgi:hypothetical protein